MTKLLDHAFTRARELPDQRQDAVAELLLEIIDQPPESLLTDEQLAEVRLALKEAEEGKFASAEELAALWSKQDR